MTKINAEEYEVLKPKLEEEYTHVGKSRDGKLQFLQGYIERDMKREEWSDGWGQTYMRPVNLFQFIQWEDEEPYNIQELIDEYLDDEYGYFNMKLSREFEEFIKKEGKESEMKDIEWLKREIHKELEDWHGVEGGIDGDGINEIMLSINQFEESEVKRLERKIKELDSYNDELIRDNNQFRNELDNQKVLSKEWIDEHSNGPSRSQYVWVDDLKEILVSKQEDMFNGEEPDEGEVYFAVGLEGAVEVSSASNIDEAIERLAEHGTSYTVSKKPTIPEFVAEFLDGKEDYMLHELFDDEWLYSKHDQIAKWLYDNDEETNREREFSLVLAHIYDYEVETEQKYYVMNNDQRMMLVRMMDGKTITEADPFKLEDMYEAEKKAHRLTEKEIKDYDERYFAFAKPVEEVEAH